MKKILTLFLTISLIASVIPMTVQAETNEINLFVAVDGNDSNSGTISSPFKTPEAARDKIRELKKSGDLSKTKINVNFRGGQYSVDTFNLWEEDSGWEGNPITYRAWKDEEATFIGGTSIKSDAWSLVEDNEILERLPEEARGKVYETDLTKLGFTLEQLGIMGYPGGYSGSDMYQSNTPVIPMGVQLYDDGEPLTIARYPNEGYIQIKTIIKNCVDWIWEKSEPRPADMDPSGFIIQYDDGRADRWTQAEDPRMYGFWGRGFADGTVDIINIDTKRKTLESGQATAFAPVIYDGASGRYYVFNLLEEIDIPGEYYMNPETGVMYYYPKDDLKNSTTYISVYTNSLMNIKDAKYITVEGLIFEASRGMGIQADNCDNLCFNYCTIRNTGDLAALITNSMNSGYINCLVYNTNGGLKIVDDDNLRKNFTHSNNYFKNNEIHDFSLYKKLCNPAIWFYGCGIYVGHNKIYNGPHMGIWMIDATDCIVEYNDIFNILLDVDDAGAIYSGQNLTHVGNEWRYNYIHDCGSTMPHLHALYMDDGDNQTRIFGNVIKNMGEYATSVIFKGRDTKVQNNISINLGEASIRAIQMTEGWFRPAHYEKLDKFIADPETGHLWLEKYPELAEYRKGNEHIPTDNIVKNNVSIDGPGIMLPDVFLVNGEIEEDLIVTSKEISYEITDDGKITIDQEKIKAQIPEWEIIDTSKFGIRDDWKYRSDYTVAESLGDSMPNVPSAPSSSSSDDKLSNTVTLAIGRNKSLSKGVLKQIDPDNASVFPQIVNSRTLVPVRFISENFGAEVGWDAATKTVMIKAGGKEIYMQIGHKMLVVNGEPIEMDVTPQIIEGRTMIPLRALCETALGKKVFWDNKGLIVISDNDKILDSTADSAYIDETLLKLAE